MYFNKVTSHTTFQNTSTEDLQTKKSQIFTNKEITDLYSPRDHRTLKTMRSQIFTNKEITHTSPMQRSQLFYKLRDHTYSTNQEITHTLPTKRSHILHQPRDHRSLLTERSQIFNNQDTGEITHTLPINRSQIFTNLKIAHLYQP